MKLITPYTVIRHMETLNNPEVFLDFFKGESFWLGFEEKEKSNTGIRLAMTEELIKKILEHKEELEEIMEIEIDIWNYEEPVVRTETIDERPIGTI